MYIYACARDDKSMDRPLEKRVETLLVTEISKAGGRAYKWTSPGNIGVPDRIVVLPNGVIEFVELKTEVGKLSELQKKQISTLAKMGQNVSVVYGMKGLSELFDYLRLYDARDKIAKRYGKEKWYDKGRIEPYRIYSL